MLKTEELNRQKIAFELHEGVAQTLAALKLKAESGQQDDAADDAAAPANSMVPMLQEAIQEVRAIATELRPASLDDLGLLPTLNWLCREFEQRHSGIRIERRLSLEEREIPAPLKGILYGIIVSVLGDIAHHTQAARVRLTLAADGKVLVLMIDDTASGGFDDTTDAPNELRLHAGFARMEQLTTLSGGAFTAAHRSDGGRTLRAAWNRECAEAEELAMTRRLRSA
jgi:two-component system NarL family sensor kinase